VTNDNQKIKSLDGKNTDDIVDWCEAILEELSYSILVTKPNQAETDTLSSR